MVIKVQKVVQTFLAIYLLLKPCDTSNIYPSNILAYIFLSWETTKLLLVSSLFLGHYPLALSLKLLYEDTQISYVPMNQCIVYVDSVSLKRFKSDIERAVFQQLPCSD